MPTNPLEMYRFKGLPFDLGRYDVPRIGRDEEWERLRQTIEMSRLGKSPVISVLLGTYGAGKSFMLWQLSRALSSPKKSGVLSSGPMRLIDPEQKKDFTRSLIIRFFSRGIDIEADLVPLLRGVDREDLNVPTSLGPFVDLLFALANPKTATVARRVVTGGKALRKEAEQAGIVETQHIKSSEDAMSLLFALQIVLRSCDVDALALLIDEVEYADALAKQQRIAVLDSIKHIWDQQVEFFSRGNEAAVLVMVLATTPTFWQQMKGQILGEAGRGETGIGVTPFFSRIRQSDIVELPAELGEKEARRLIVSRMTEQRPGSKRDEIIPFTDDYVDYVYQLSQGLPRRILEICGVVLQEAGERRIREINAAHAKKILRELLISYEPLVTSSD